MRARSRRSSRPPSSRSVRATCALLASAGWQHVKMSLSRSSCTGPSSAGATRAGSSAGLRVMTSQQTACRFLSCRAGLPARAVDPLVAGGRDQPARRARRQAVGGQRSSAAAKASWTASSATVDIAEDADQDRYGSAVLLPEDPLDLRGGRPGPARSALAAVIDRPHLERAAQ